MAAGAGGAPMGALEGALLRYDEALAHKSAALPKLDGWYRAELRKAIAKRAHENGAATLEATERNQQGSTAAAGYLTRLELAKLIKWKMTVRPPEGKRGMEGTWRRCEKLASKAGWHFLGSLLRTDPMLPPSLG